MEIFVLITCLCICQAFPSPKIGSSKVTNALTQVKDEITTTLPNLKVLLENSDPEKANKSSNHKEIIQAIEKINALKSGRSRTFGTLASFAVGGLLAALDLVEEVIEGNTASTDEDTGNFLRMRRQEETTTEFSTSETTTDYQIPTATSDLPTTDPSSAATTEIASFVTTLRNIQNEFLNEIEGNSTKIRQPRQEDEEEEEEGEGGGGGLVGAIISGFLGSLSKPDGSVDVDAVVSVLGMLSAAREDGTYDFQGLTDTLSAFFGGDDEGGSDVGSFVGGLAAASIAGVANKPPGAKGAGTFTGNLLKQVLPALSGPGPTEEGVTTTKPQVNAGGFLWGLLNSLFGNGGGNTGMKPVSSFLTIKMNLVKFLFSALSSILAASSSSGKNKDW